MTIDELIYQAEIARNDSPLKGNTCVALCESERGYVNIVNTYLDDSDGSIFLVYTETFPGIR